MIINSYIYGVAASYDVDAQAFFNAESTAGVTLTTTQKDAVNTLVVNLKAANIWTKMKAVYPIVGGTATAHKFNLKNPLDTDAAFRLVFNGGWTHGSTGMLPNGSNGYANTYFVPSVNSSGLNNFHNSYYSRSNVNLTQVEMGCGSSDLQGTLLEIRTGNTTYNRINSNTNSTYSDTDSLGFYSQSRLLSNQQKGFKNGILKVTGSVNSNSAPTQNFYIGAYNNSNSPFYYSSKQCAFASIGDGLTDLEAQVFNQIVEGYQFALGRNINPSQSFYYNTAYNNETNAFLYSTQITDATIQTATNTLVSDLKTANLWTKMKAIYPMVGGTATTCKFNLANSMDIDSAFRLTFAGGWTYSVNGALPNGTNAYANTFFVPNGNLTLYNSHLSYYSRTSTMPTTDKVLMGGANNTSISNTKQQFYLSLNANTFYAVNNSTASVSDYASIGSQTSMSGLLMNNRTSSTSTTLKIWKNGNSLASATTTPGGENLLTNSLYLAARRNMTTSAPYAEFFYNGECAFASIGDGLTDAEALALYNAVQTFNTTLNRQVP